MMFSIEKSRKPNSMPIFLESLSSNAKLLTQVTTLDPNQNVFAILIVLLS